MMNGDEDKREQQLERVIQVGNVSLFTCAPQLCCEQALFKAEDWCHFNLSRDGV